MDKARKGHMRKEIWRRFCKNKAAVIGLIILTVIVLLAVCADLIVPYEKVIAQSGS